MNIYDLLKCFISVLSGNITVFAPPVKFLSVKFFRNNIPNNIPDELWIQIPGVVGFFNLD